MAKFILVYRGPATPMEAVPPEESAKIGEAWGAWIGKVGSALVDVGAPFAAGTAVAGDGSTSPAADLHGYSIVDVADIDAAQALCDGHPFLSDGTSAFSVEVHELVQMEM